MKIEFKVGTFNIFNGNLALCDPEQCAARAREAGYKMFSWNGDAYRVPNRNDEDPLSQPLGFSVSN